MRLYLQHSTAPPLSEGLGTRPYVYGHVQPALSRELMWYKKVLLHCSLIRLVLEAMEMFLGQPAYVLWLPLASAVGPTPRSLRC